MIEIIIDFFYTETLRTTDTHITTLTPVPIFSIIDPRDKHGGTIRPLGGTNKPWGTTMDPMGTMAPHGGLDTEDGGITANLETYLILTLVLLKLQMISHL